MSEEIAVDDNLEARPDMFPVTRVNSVYPMAGEWELMSGIAKTLVSSGMLPSTIDTPQKALAIMLKGRELGIPAMQSFTHIYVVSGKPACSSELMLGLMARGGVTWKWINDGRDRKEAVIQLSRENFEDYTSRFTKEDADKIQKQEGGKTVKATDTATWKQYMPNMLRSRAISNAARAFAPDLIGGMSYTIEELMPHDSLVAVEAEVKVVEEEAKQDAVRRKAERDFARRSGQGKRIIKAVKVIVGLTGSMDAIHDFFTESYGMDYHLASCLSEETGEEMVFSDGSSLIPDLEEVLTSLRELYKEVQVEAWEVKDDIGPVLIREKE